MDLKPEGQPTKTSQPTQGPFTRAQASGKHLPSVQQPEAKERPLTKITGKLSSKWYFWAKHTPFILVIFQTYIRNFWESLPWGYQQQYVCLSESLLALKTPVSLKKELGGGGGGGIAASPDKATHPGFISPTPNHQRLHDCYPNQGLL